MPNQSAKEQMYKSISYDKVEAIQGLLHYYHEFKSKGQENFIEEVVCIYADIDNALSGIKITKRQNEAIKYYMEGWTTEEIGEKMFVSHQAVRKLIMKVCYEIYIYLN
ncbi:helix-turn-helix transcriptional regulator [Paenibacillus chitinolyticus]|uniref:helix-turn-helix transcriptional regulator n=1 Tax=Paenibacillus chitinolyticus TaxID=79263 RepID=UPI003D02A271